MAYFRKMCEKSLFSTASFNVRFLTHPENSKLRPFGSFNHFYYKAWLGLLPLNNKKFYAHPFPCLLIMYTRA